MMNTMFGFLSCAKRLLAESVATNAIATDNSKREEEFVQFMTKIVRTRLVD